MNQERTGLQVGLGGERGAEEEAAQGKTGVCGTKPRDQEPSGPASPKVARPAGQREPHLKTHCPNLSLTVSLTHTRIHACTFPVAHTF